MLFFFQGGISQPNYFGISFLDEPGCFELYHGHTFVQEKHGFAGPADITPWPPYEEQP